MLTKTVTYTDFNGKERKDILHFNLTKSELVDMETETEGGLLNKIERLSSDDSDGVEIMKIFKNLLLRSYGEKSEDGKSFIKSEEKSKAFTQTIAYDTFFMELVTNPEAAAEFINALIPDFDEVDKAKLAPVTPVE